MTDNNEFSVYQFYEDGTNQCVVQFVSAAEAVKTAYNNIPITASRVVRVMITDGGDCCCFDWQAGKGIVFPTKEDMKHESAPAN